MMTNPPLDIIGQSVLSDGFVLCPMGAEMALSIGHNTRTSYTSVLCPMLHALGWHRG